MNNLQMMKQNLIKQIKEMDLETYFEFSSILNDVVEAGQLDLDLSFVLTCIECRELFGNCYNGSENCYKRFSEYAKREQGKD